MNEYSYIFTIIIYVVHIMYVNVICVNNYFYACLLLSLSCIKCFMYLIMDNYQFITIFKLINNNTNNCRCNNKK